MNGFTIHEWAQGAAVCGQLYRENYKASTVSRTKGRVNRCPKRQCLLHGIFVAVTLYDYTFLF